MTVPEATVGKNSSGPLCCSRADASGFVNHTETSFWAEAPKGMNIARVRGSQQMARGLMFEFFLNWLKLGRK